MINPTWNKKCMIGIKTQLCRENRLEQLTIWFDIHLLKIPIHCYWHKRLELATWNVHAKCMALQLLIMLVHFYVIIDYLHSHTCVSLLTAISTAPRATVTVYSYRNSPQQQKSLYMVRGTHPNCTSNCIQLYVPAPNSNNHCIQSEVLTPTATVTVYGQRYSPQQQTVTVYCQRYSPQLHQ